MSGEERYRNSCWCNLAWKIAYRTQVRFWGLYWFLEICRGYRIFWSIELRPKPSFVAWGPSSPNFESVGIWSYIGLQFRWTLHRTTFHFFRWQSTFLVQKSNVLIWSKHKPRVLHRHIKVHCRSLSDRFFQA